MPTATAGDAPDSFFVEHFCPGVRAYELRRAAARVRAAAAAMAKEGKALRCVSSTVIPNDESLLCLFEAPREELVREAYERAGVRFERISAAVNVEESETPA
jgi:hypothetical protein